MSTQPASSKPIYPPFYFLLAIALMIGLHRLAPGRRILSIPYRYPGAILLAAGILVVVWAAWIFHRTGTTIRPFEESSALVVSGPYRVTRNPIYLAMVFGLLGVGVILGSLTPFVVIPPFAYLLDRRFIRAEEAQLERTFGSRYAAYKAAVRRWL